ncbi:hypothetical protein [Bacillus cereus]|uniref:hypothetical protein n=1 Tax=Bacillus cereus TaxID=1396 RepID=UPI001F1EE452|nr:hypothetical protein [Bacillus cereus]BCB35575.1 hypothetical protein BCM0045_0470 [Bacillus cereus]BCB98385.1 hypothetical protein BCM0057_0468 [Bacillus cereus]BCC21878.1 hypothetical protein BCM0079_0471 [Bacillus cereus]BCC33489.1 hypothetical protein BCM0105_0479 [Bacillus cereus]
MNIGSNLEGFLEELSLLKNDLVNSFGSINVEKYREDYKGKYSPERFKDYFLEKLSVHAIFKYLLIRMIEESMQRVKVKLNEEGLSNWHEMSKNFRKDYDTLFQIAINDVKREKDLASIFKETVFDEKQFIEKTDKVMLKHIPLLAKYDFKTMDANATLTLIDNLYNADIRDELQRFYQPSPIIDFLLQQVGLI